MKNHYEVLKRVISEAPQAPGVYRMLSDTKEILYIGKAKILPNRLKSYLDFERHSYRIKRMISRIADVELTVTNTEAEALLLEANLIKEHQPQYNIALKDDKSFPYIAFSSGHPYPRLVKLRSKTRPNGECYGPFASATAVNETMVELQKIFLVRPCSDAYFASRTRPCLQYEIKRCSAPCVGKIGEADYKSALKMAQDFLNGKNKVVHERLIAQMEDAAEQQNYELAAKIRDRLKILNSIQSSNVIAEGSHTELDLVVFVRSNSSGCMQIYFIRNGKNLGNVSYFFHDLGEDDAETIEQGISQFYINNIPAKEIWISDQDVDTALIEDMLSINKRCKVKSPKSRINMNLIDFAMNNASLALKSELKKYIQAKSQIKALADFMEMAEPPNRIEVYDNSHIQGENAIGGMVVFQGGALSKNHYRKFNIRELSVGDDYAMMRQVMARRVSNIKNWGVPDIMLIDGGLGHLNAVRSVLLGTELENVKLLAISKGEKRNAGRELLHRVGHEPIMLPRNTELLMFLQVLRDEAHRFAISSHRSKRTKALRASVLDNIPGIGAKRKKVLLQHFGSVEDIKNATVDDLASVSGIDRKIAKEIFDYLHS